MKPLCEMSFEEIENALRAREAERRERTRENGPFDFKAARILWTEEIQTGTGICEWEAQYIDDRTGQMKTAVGKIPWQEDGSEYYEIGYWTPEKAKFLSRFEGPRAIPGVKEGRSGWTIVYSTSKTHKSSPYLYPTFGEAQSAAEKHALWDEKDNWPADSVTLAPVVESLNGAGYQVIDIH